MTTFLDLIAPLLQDQAGVVGAQLFADDPEGFVAEQALVAKFITLLRGDSPDVQFQVGGGRVSESVKKERGGVIVIK